jgi:putative transposase
MKRANARLYHLNHSTYICTYHIVWGTRRREKYFGSEYNKQELKKMLKSISKWKGFIIHSWHVGDEHVHLVITIPPKYSVAYAVNILKGKSSSWMKKKTVKLEASIWARGYFVSTVGINEHAVRIYVEGHGERLKDLQMELIKQAI